MATFSKRTLAALLVAGLAACNPTATEPVRGANAVLPADRVTQPAFHKALNAARAQQGLGPLAPSNILVRVAQDHARDMAQRAYFAHVSPEGQSAMDRAVTNNVPACGIGENIAFGQDAPMQAFSSWMASPGHRANMLHPKMRSYGLAREGDIWVLMVQSPC